MMDSEKVMELAQAVSDANARLDAADDLQRQAYEDSCLAEEALLDYLGSVVTKAASAPAEEIETDGSAHVTIDPVTVIDATGDTGDLNGIGTSMSVGLVGEGANADPDSPVIGSFSEVSDEAVRAAGGDPVSRVDALNAAAQIVPDYGPIEG